MEKGKSYLVRLRKRGAYDIDAYIITIMNETETCYNIHTQNGYAFNGNNWKVKKDWHDQWEVLEEYKLDS